MDKINNKVECRIWCWNINVFQSTNNTPTTLIMPVNVKWAEWTRLCWL